MEQLSSVAADEAGCDLYLCPDGNGPQIGDVHLPRHCQNSQRSVQLAHCFIKQRRNDPAVHVTRCALVPLVEHHGRGGCMGIAINLEREVQTFRVLRTASEAVARELIDGLFHLTTYLNERAEHQLNVS